MDSDNNNQDNADSVAALKDLTAELESLKASDLAAETASDAANVESTGSTSADAPEPSISTEEATASELPDKPNLEVPTEPIIPDEPAAPAFDPSTLESSNETSESSTETVEDTSNIPENSVADFTNVSTDDSSKEESDKEEDKKDLPPIKPAAPVPGSIGSAKSYEDYQTDEANRAEKQADKAAKEADRAAREANTKKTTSTSLILGIVIAAIAVIAAVIFAIVIITGKSKNNTATTTPEPTPEPTPVQTSITCTKSVEGAELAALGQATEANITYTATYFDDKLNDMSEKTVIEYSTVDDANNGATALKNAYESTLALINLEQDPFDSTYPVVGTTLTITHLADSDDITKDNFAIFGLQVDDEGEVKTAIKDIEDLYTEKDFTCVIK